MGTRLTDRMAPVLEELAEHADGLPWLGALMVVEGGETTHASYHHDLEATTRHPVKSVSKSVLSLLVGIAVDRGLLSLDTTLGDQLGDHFDGDADPAKAAISVDDLLAMRSGLEWVENDVVTVRWGRSEDPVRFSLGPDQPLVHRPGRTWCYSTADTHLLGACLRRATGIDLENLLHEWLLEPLDAPAATWPDLGASGEFQNAGAGLLATVPTIARLAELVRLGGRWDGHQLVSSQWLEYVTTPQPDVDEHVILGPEAGARLAGRMFRSGYARQWWTASLGPAADAPAMTSRSMQGYGGQHAAIVDELDLVIVVFSHDVPDPAAVARFEQALEEGHFSPVAEPLTDHGRRLYAELRQRAITRQADPLIDGTAGSNILITRLATAAMDADTELARDG